MISWNHSQLEILLRAYGLNEEYEQIADALPFKTENFELVDVLNVMTRMNYTGAPLKTRLCDLDPRLLPCLFVQKPNLPIRAITEVMPEKTFGTAYIFTKQKLKDPKEQKETLIASGQGWFKDSLKRFQSIFVKVVSIGVFLNIIALALPIFLMAIYDRVADLTSSQAVYMLGLGALIALLIEAGLRILRSRNLAWFAARIDSMVSNRVLSRLLQLPPHAIERASVPSQIARLRAFDGVREFFTGPLFLTLLDLPFTIFAFVTLAVFGGVLALIPLGLLVIYSLFFAYFRPRLKILMFHSARSRSESQMHHIELFEKLEPLRLNGMSEIWSAQFRDISAAGSLSSFRAQQMGQLLETIIYTITTLSGLLVIYLGVLQVWGGAMTGGALFASLIFFWRVIAPWQTLASNLPRLEQLLRTIQQIDRLMEIDTEREAAIALGKPGKLQGCLEFSKVGLRYSRENDSVFVGLNFLVRPGERITVSGANGSGKSTVLKLALGLYQPQAGAIYLDRYDIRQLDPIQMRKQIAYVPQIPELFSGTIADNLRLGSPFASEHGLWAALDLAGARQEVENMPLGLDTPVLCGNHSLPSGLSYQLVLARAYLRDAPIILFDEMPYAVLNSPTGKAFVERLKDWHGKKTVLMVSHRDDHIRMGDQSIGLLSGGRSIIGDPDHIIRELRDESYAHDIKRAA